MEPIRLTVTVDKSTGAAPVITDLGKSIDTSIQYATQRATTSLDSLSSKMVSSFEKIGESIAMKNVFSSLENNLLKITDLLDKIEQKAARIRGAGAGAGNQANTGATPAGIQAIESQLLNGGFRPTGAGTTRIDRNGNSSSTTQLQNTAGSTATLNDDLTSLTIRDRATKAIQERIDAATKILMEQGFEEVSRKFTSGSLGDSSTSAFRDITGRKASLNRQSGSFAIDEALANSGTLADLTAAQSLRKRITDANDYLGKGGFTEFNRQYVQNAQGAGTISRYKNKVGQTASLNSQTGNFSAQELGGEDGGDGSAGGGGGGGGAGDFFNKFLRIGIYTIALRQISGAVREYLIAPFTDFTKEIIQANDEFRKFEISISGITGSVQRSKAVSESIIQLSRKSPLTISELQNETEAAAFIPSLTSGIASRDQGKVTQSIDEFTRVASKLKFLAPEQGDRGVSIALREAYASQFQSISRRFNIRKEDLAASIGLTFEQLNANPDKIVPALQAYLDSVVPDSAFDELANRFEVRVDKLRDSFRVGAKRIGDAGFYDDLTGRVKSVSDSLNSFFDSPDFDFQSQRISGSLTNVIGNVGKGGLGFLSGLSGSKNNANSVSGVVDQISSVIDKVADLTNALAPLGEALGVIANKTLTTADYLASHIPFVGEAGDIDNKTNAYNAISRLTGVKVGYSTEQSNYGNGVLQYLGKVGQLAIGGGWASEPIEGFKDKTTATFQLPPNVDASKFQKLVDLAVKSGGRLPDNLNPVDFGFSRNYQFDNVNDLGTDKKALDKIGNPNYAAQARSVNSVFSRFSEEQVGISEFIKYKTQSKELFQKGSGLADVIKGIEEDNAIMQAKLGETKSDLLLKLSEQGINTTTDQRRDEFGSFNNNIAQFGRAGDDKSRDAAQVKIEKYVNSFPENIRDVLNTYEKTVKRSDAFNKNSSAVVDELAKQVPESIEQYALGLAKRLDSSAVGARELDPIFAGTSEFADGIAKTLKEKGIELKEKITAKFSDFKLESQLFITNAYDKKRGQEIRAAGPYGGENDQPGLSASQLRSRAQRPLDDNQQTRALLAQKLSEKDLYDTQYQTAQEAYYRPGHTGQDAENFKTAQRNVEVNSREIQQLQDQLNEVQANFRQFGATVRGDLDNSLGEGIDRLITHTGKLKDVLIGFANDVTSAFSHMLSSNILNSLIGNLGQPQASGQNGGGQNGLLVQLGQGLGNILGGIFGASTAGTNTGGSAPAAPNQPVYAADGAIFPGGFRAFAYGGIVRGGHGTLGLIGEGGPGKDEGVVPMKDGAIPLRMDGNSIVAALPNGRSIPAKFHSMHRYADGGVAAGGFNPMAGYYNYGSTPVSGGDDGSGSGGRGQRPSRTYFYVKDEADARRQGYQPTKDDIIGVVRSDFANGGPISKTARRSQG